ncbi:hypothetical protein ACRAKI_05805 [Saccharothrix isguenensis]
MVLFYIEVQGIIGVVALEGKVARRWLGPSEAELLRLRIDELAASPPQPRPRGRPAGPGARGVPARAGGPA